jgi:hypothetical protein
VCTVGWGLHLGPRARYTRQELPPAASPTPISRFKTPTWRPPPRPQSTRAERDSHPPRCGCRRAGPSLFQKAVSRLGADVALPPAPLSPRTCAQRGPEHTDPAKGAGVWIGACGSPPTAHPILGQVRRALATVARLGRTLTLFTRKPSFSTPSSMSRPRCAARAQEAAPPGPATPPWRGSRAGDCGPRGRKWAWRDVDTCRLAGPAVGAQGHSADLPSALPSRCAPSGDPRRQPLQLPPSSPKLVLACHLAWCPGLTLSTEGVSRIWSHPKPVERDVGSEWIEWN